jgi:hypothetical protein
VAEPRTTSRNQLASTLGYEPGRYPILVARVSQAFVEPIRMPRARLRHTHPPDARSRRHAHDAAVPTARSAQLGQAAMTGMA